MRKIISSLCSTIFCATLILSALLTVDTQTSAAAPASKDGGPEVNAAVQHDTSPPLRGMSSQSPGAENQREKPLRTYPGVKSNKPQADGALQSTPGPLVSTTNGLNFAGVGNGDYGFSVSAAPPDTNGAVGATQYVQWVNSSFAVFDKVTGAIAAGFPKTGNTLWSGFGGGCQNNNDGDPIVQYDKAANRWVLTQFSVSTTPYLQCVAVSTTSDATGSYNRYAFSYGSGFNDYPKLGIWPDGYYITFNIFNNGSTFAGAKVCSYDRNSMLAGAAATQQCFNTSTSYGGLLPSDLDGSTPPPAGSPNYLVGLDSTPNSLALWKFHVDWTTPTNSTFTGPISIPVAAYSEACSGGTCIPQSGTNQKLDSLADRMMYRLAYRNFGDHESLVVNHSVTAGTSVGVRWYELRNPGGTPTVYQQSTFAPDSTYRWMGSIAMDRQGNIALGYSASSSSIFPAIRYTGRLVSDPLNTMQAENSLIAGGGSQSGQSLSRWGDYSAMTIDPVDDCTFWYTNEYLKSTGAFNWSTRIGSFKFPNCGTTTINDFSISANPSTVSLTQGNSGTSTISTVTTSGTAQTVALSVSGVPAGASASFNPTSVNSGSSSTLTVNSGTAAAGTYTLTVTGTGTSATHTTTINLTISGTVTNDFSISASPSSLSLVQGNSGTSTISTATTSGSAQSVSLSISGVPAGASASFSPASVTSGSSSTLTVNSGTAAAGTYTLTVTGTGTSATHTTTISLTVTSSTTTGITNGGFETGSLSGWTSTGTTGVVSSGAHSGTYAARLGSTTPTNGDSSISQTFTVPSGSNQLSFWYKMTCPDTVTYDWATATLKDNTAGTTATVLPKVCATNSSYVQVSATLTAGHGYTLTLTSHDDNYSGDPSYTLYDDVAIGTTAPPPTGITNGGFETGNLSGWTSTGTTGVVSSGAHSGTYAARLGSTTPTNGDSTINQTFTAPTGNTQLGLWYKMTCPDTVTYDWATVTLKDNTAGTTTTILPKTCSTNSAWVNLNASITAGHSYTLTLVSHDDNYAGDPTYTLYDDVATS